MIGFKQTIYRFRRDERFAGESKYPYRKLIKLALDGIFSFSSAPLKAIGIASLVLWGLSLVYSVITVIAWIASETPPGWASLIILMTVYTGLILMSIAVVGAYVGRIFEQGQHRPLYWLERTRNIDTRPVRTADHREARLNVSVASIQDPNDDSPTVTVKAESSRSSVN